MENFDSRTPSSRTSGYDGRDGYDSPATQKPGDSTPNFRNPIYRAAYRYFFENYGSSRFGTAGKYRSNTLIGVFVAAAGAIYIAPSWRHGNVPELAISVLIAADGLIMAARNAPEWRKYARLAQKFASGAVQGGLKAQGGKDLDPCATTADIPALFEAVYPWC